MHLFPLKEGEEHQNDPNIKDLNLKNVVWEHLILSCQVSGSLASITYLNTWIDIFEKG